MGSSYTPTFRIETTGSDMAVCPDAWDCKRMGRPSAKNLEAVLVRYLKSCEPGGVNYHLTEMLGHLPNMPTTARVVRQSTGEIVAEWTCPMFYVVS